MYDLKPQARPYAKAAFLAAVEEGQINEMFGDLKVLSEAQKELLNHQTSHLFDPLPPVSYTHLTLPTKA